MSVIRLEQLIAAYTQGAFPMAEDAGDASVSWYTANPRAIFPITGDDPAGAFHAPRSLLKLDRQAPYDLRMDQRFDTVIQACAELGPGREDTWINESIMDVFNEAFQIGFAHCVTAFEKEELIGGIYGLALGGAFFAESMFSRRPNASKLCLLRLVRELKNRGFTLLDVQFTNPHLKQFGVVEITAEDYQDRLDHALALGRCW